MRMLHPCNPETATRTRTPVTYNPMYLPSIARQLFSHTSHIVGRQDNWAVRKQNANYLEAGDDRDLSSRFDKAGLRYRKLYSALVERQSRETTHTWPTATPVATSAKHSASILARDKPLGG